MPIINKAVAPIALLLFACAPAGAGGNAKEHAVLEVEKVSPDMIRLSEEIWRLAETALREERSSRLLSDYAEAKGFSVSRGAAGMPTAFTATFGSGRPIVGIMGEFDALPGLSQKAQPSKEDLASGAAGHGCGHNLFGPASLGAAVAVKELIERGELRGTVVFFGTPAEEAVGGKIYMVRDGLFKGLDAAIAWHPDTEISAETDSSQAMVDLRVEFKGKAAHAAYDPWNARSALDGLELFTHALNLMREHVKPTVRMHYVVLDGGRVPNVVPDSARLWCWLRDSKRDGVEELLARVRKIAEGAGLAAGVEVSTFIQSGSPELLPNMAGSRVLHKNLEWLGPLSYSEAEIDFARKLQAAAGVAETGMDGEVKPFDESPGDPEGGSTDVADVSWNVPTIHLTVATAPRGIPWHSWAVVAASGSPIGRRGMIYAAKAMAATTADFFEGPEILNAMQKEFKEATGGRLYEAWVPDGPPPIPTK